MATVLLVTVGSLPGAIAQFHRHRYTKSSRAYGRLLPLPDPAGRGRVPATGGARPRRTLRPHAGDFLERPRHQFLRGKLTCYEPGLCVPLIIRWPNEGEPGWVREEMISTIDLRPTIMEAVGATAPAGLSGRSLLGLTRSPNMQWREWIHAEFHAHYPPLDFPQRSITNGRYKMIVNLIQDRPNPKSARYPSLPISMDLFANSRYRIGLAEAAASVCNLGRPAAG